MVATHSAEVSDLANLGVHRSSIRVVPWGVDTSMFTPDGPVAQRNGRPRLLTVADLRERAALETLLRALTRVPNAELMVVGGPADSQQHAEAYTGLAKFAAALGISDRVIFSGQVERSAMPALLRSADLVVSTCQYEPSGMTSLQAMACGTPVIAPPVDGHADAVVDGTTGILIPPGLPPCWPSGSGSCSRTPCSWRRTGWRRSTGPGPATPGTASRPRRSPSTTRPPRPRKPSRPHRSPGSTMLPGLWFAPGRG